MRSPDTNVGRAAPLILFVDDDPRAGELMLRFSQQAPFDCRVFRDPEAALDYFAAEGADLVVSDLRMPALDGTELLAKMRALDSELPFIIVTAYSTVDDAIAALRLGATDFIKKPFDMEELMVLVEKTLEGSRLRRENRLLRRQLSDERSRFGMIGHAPALREVFRVVEKIADVRCNVLIEGESGTGKELAARAIHNLSQDAERPFVVIDCGALSDTLLESELFGHEKGAFTGASHTTQGLLEAASGGTVLLDEIGNISDALQTRLLRVVQEQEVTRVGGVRPIAIDVRFLAATHRGLERMVAAGAFRADLYHRLNVIQVHMPALRERREDIPLLAQSFVEEFARRYRRDVRGFDPESLTRLCAYDWPGNVRELRNLVERLVALAEVPELQVQQLGAEGGDGGEGVEHGLPPLEELERRYILKLLHHHDGSRERTAAALGINKSTLWRKLQQYEREGRMPAEVPGGRTTDR